MKLTTKYTLLLVSILFFTQNMCAQDDRDFRVGFKIIPGINWVKNATNNVNSDGSGIGFSFGLMGDFRLADNYFFSPEIQVTTMSNRIKLKPDSVYTLESGDRYNNISYKYNLKYLEIPLNFKFRTKESNGIRYWGTIGIAPGFLIGNNATILTNPVGTASNKFPTDEKYIPNDGQYDRFDFREFGDDINFIRASMILGAGIEYNLSDHTSFYTGIRFNNGFTDILNDKKSKVINNVLGLEIGIFF